jgi:hypothetical protein
VQGAAWSVPVIAIAAPVPAFAGASQGELTVLGNGCKLPGASNSTFKGNTYKLVATNTTADPLTIKVVSVTLNGQDLGSVALINLNGCTAAGNPFTVPGVPPTPRTLTFALLTQNAPNSQNGTLIVSYQVSTDGGVTFGPTKVTSVLADGGDAPPINGASCGPDRFTKPEKKCIGGFAPPALWAANTTYATGDVVRLSTGETLEATVGGTSGATQPTAPTGNNTVTDGTVTWKLF